MVNLVVRHSQHLQSTSMHQRSKSPAVIAKSSTPTNRNASPMRLTSIQNPATTTNQQPPKHTHRRGYDRNIPSPIRVPYLQTHRAVSPLTTTESIFSRPTDRQDEVVHQHQQHTPYLSATPEQHRGRDPAASSGSSSGVSEGSSGGNNIPRPGGPTTPRGIDPSPLLTNSDGDFICDYDSNVTALYELLESSHWDAARVRCRTHPEEVQTWIVRRDAKTRKIRWQLLPLHAAVIFQAPTSVVNSMLEQYPAAASRKDDQGMLPLHLAFRHKQQDETLLELLLERYPEGVSVKDRRDRLPIEHGKETQFTFKLVQAYSNAQAMCVHDEQVHHQQVEDDAVVQAATEQIERELKESYESQMATLKNMYEERLEAMAHEHEAAMEELRHQADRDQETIRNQHESEMEDLRDLLSREVGGAGQRASELEMEANELRTSMEQANQEVEMLRNLCHGQKNYQDDLHNEIRQILQDQQTLHAYCAKQQEKLQEAQQMREQLLRTLLHKEEDTNNKDTQISDDILQVSDNIRLRVEKMLSRIPPDHDGDEDDEVDNGHHHHHHHILLQDGDPAEEPLHRQSQLQQQEQQTSALGGLPEDSDAQPHHELLNDHHHHHDDDDDDDNDVDGNGVGWTPPDAHEDDISAITENSNF